MAKQAKAEVKAVELTKAQSALINQFEDAAIELNLHLVDTRAASIKLTVLAVKARQVFNDVDVLRHALKDSFEHIVEDEGLTLKTAQNYISYVVAIWRAAVLPEGIEKMPLQTANKEVRAANPGQYQTRQPRVGGAAPAGGRGKAGAKAPGPKAPATSAVSNPLADLADALERVRAMARSDAALSLVAELTDLASDLAQALAADCAA
jgi:hypothetical protein